MRLPLTIVVMSLVLTVSFGLYRLESKVQILERQLAKATTQLADNQHNLNILAAEWSFLSQPSRIQALARRHLELRGSTAEQIGQITALPPKILEDTTRNENATAEQQAGQLPIPGWKPVKRGLNRGERIILAEHGWKAR